mgnify:CR=1 FL=1
MDPASLLFVGLELSRLSGGETGAATLGDSLEAIEAGGLALSPFEGPVLQPVIGWRSRRLALSLAPGLAGSSSTARSTDGREARVSTLSWKGEARAWVLAGPALVGLDLGLSGATASSQGEAVASAPLLLELAPTAGVRGALSEQLDLVPRLRLPVRVSEGATTWGLGGALMIEWHP